MVNGSKRPSLRQIAADLGISHTLLVLWRQGKRNLAPELEARYHQLVTIIGYKFVTTQACHPRGLGGELIQIRRIWWYPRQGSNLRPAA